MRYFFNLAGAVHDRDDLGQQLAGPQEARIYAVVHASEIIRERPELVWAGDEVRVEVTDREVSCSLPSWCWAWSRRPPLRFAARGRQTTRLNAQPQLDRGE